MTKLHVKSGDKVVVLAGKDKGKTGAILNTNPKNNKVVVKGINVVSKHKKPRSAQDKGGINKVEAGIDSSNVQIICPACNKATRVAITLNDKKQKVRTCKKCGASLDTNKPVKKVKKEAPKAAEAPKTTAAEKAQKTEEKKTTVKTARTTAPAAKSVVKTTNKKSSPSRKTAGK